MQYSGLIIVSALSTGAALFNIPRNVKLDATDVDAGTARMDMAALSHARAVSKQFVDSVMPLVCDNNSSQCDFMDMIYGDVSLMPSTDDACEVPAMPELASDNAQDQDPWSLVKQWTSRRVTADTDPRDLYVVTVAEKDAQAVASLKNAPRVACIAVLPKGPDTFQRVRRLVDNFVEQTYEGSMQLIIVANDDGETKEVLASFTDGIVIKALHTAVDRTPLAALYREGVAEADDADVLARWDSQAWHHPQRLALQIHSMALTGRPVSHLKTWTTEGSEAPRLEDLGEPTLVAEKEWMKRYWYPGQHEEQLQTAHSRHFVELDLPDLLVFRSTC